MRILLLGRNGQLGRELYRCLLPQNDLFSFDYPDFDLRDEGSIHSIIWSHRPNLIINACAYTNVDDAESNPDVANSINGYGVGILARDANAIHASLIHFSTDFVFDGNRQTPYTESIVPNPINIYGKSKLLGEQLIHENCSSYLILRLAWLYSLQGNNFVTNFRKWIREKENVYIVNDQVGNPTWARLIAEIISQMIIPYSSSDIYSEIEHLAGIYHLAGDGFVSKYDWAKKILELDSHHNDVICRQIIPANSDRFNSRAKRPHNSSLDCSRFYSTFHLRLPDWSVALSTAMEGD